MGEMEGSFAVLRRSADATAVAALERLVREAPDRALHRINVLDFATRHGLDEERVTAAFLHATRIGLFELSWNVLCPSCGGVLDATATLKSVRHDAYYCAFCALESEPTLDQLIEVTFTISPRVRHIAAHHPASLPIWEYFRQIFCSSSLHLPEERLEERLEELTLDSVELPPGDKAVLSLQLPAGFVIVFDPVSHRGHFIDAKGEPTRERQHVSIVFHKVRSPTGTEGLHPGPLRLLLENRTDTRVLPAVWIADGRLAELSGRRKPFMTANRLLSNQTFRDLYRTDTLTVDQRLKITSLTFLFTDLKASTELYERVGDLAAFNLVRSHFRVLLEIVAAESGAVVKTIGDAVMATFLTPDRAVSAALRMREAMCELNAVHGRQDLLLKIGIHEGPCLAVLLNDRQDYFGQTVNVASRVQGMADATAIIATEAVVQDAQSARLLESSGLKPAPRNAVLRGLTREVMIYDIPYSDSGFGSKRPNRTTTPLSG
jgi:class 3 adenylate cyclase